MNNEEEQTPTPEPVTQSGSNRVIEPISSPESFLEPESVELKPTEPANTELNAPEQIISSEPVSPIASEPVTPVVPQATIASVPQVVAPEVSHVNTPGVIVLQWLSYAFWGWLIIALIWLMSVILINAMLGISVSSVVPYAIAAGVVLLPIAFLTDLFYRKHEPLKKTGAAMIIMVIHAVIFALLAIGALIVAVFNGLNAVIESSNVDSQMVILYTSIGAALLYAITFIRTLNPFKTNKPLLIYSVLMLTVTVTLLVLAFVGPLVQALATKDDRRIEENLPVVSRSINNYIQTNETLPTSLNDVSFENEEAKSLVNDNLVEYKAETSLPNKYSPSTIQHRYQLCVTFKEKAETGSYDYGYSSSNTSDYTSYLSTYGHKKGNVCYKMQETTQSSTNSIDLKALKL